MIFKAPSTTMASQVKDRNVSFCPLGLVRGYKLTKKLTPATIRHRIGALRRCLDWHVTVGNLPLNPLKLLPERYATYNDAERAAVGDDAPDADNARDRRLEDGEEARILTGDQISLEKRTIFLDDTKNGDNRQVPLSSTAIAVLSE